MGTEIMYRHICDVCQKHIKDETYKLTMAYAPVFIPQPAYQKLFGTRVMCDDCYNVLENVAVAIAPGMMSKEQTVRTDGTVESSTA